MRKQDEMMNVQPLQIALLDLDVLYQGGIKYV
jgi:hypothetical protein